MSHSLCWFDFTPGGRLMSTLSLLRAKQIDTKAGIFVSLLNGHSEVSARPGSSPRPAPWVKVAGPGCPALAAMSYYGDGPHQGTEGFQASSAGGGWGQDGCSGDTEVNRVPAPGTATGDMAVRQYRPPAKRHCKAEVYIPDNNESTGLAHYAVTPRNDTDNSLSGSIALNQGTLRGRWYTLGTFTAPEEGLSIVVVGKPNTDRHTITTSAARLTC
ncbi:hypothetical protein [Streptomyces sp. NPDC101115]|uniref:hypothetical protein n=1 Tax=Streptomyces sp. NPDC101115 TaxID=3366106 RepID=UPI00380B43E1